VRSLTVVNGHTLINHLPGLHKVTGSLQQKLSLEDSVDALGQCILIAVVAIGHGTPQSMGPMNPLVVIRAILNAPVRMVNQLLATLTMLERRLQCLADLLGVQTVVNVMSDDLSGVRIGHQAQVDKSTLSGQISDISHPYLFSSVGLNLLTAGLKQIWVAAKPMVALSSLVVRPLGRNQHMGLAQNTEQRIATDLQPLVFKRV